MKDIVYLTMVAQKWPDPLNKRITWTLITDFDDLVLAQLMSKLKTKLAKLPSKLKSSAKYDHLGLADIWILLGDKIYIVKQNTEMSFWKDEICTKIQCSHNSRNLSLSSKHCRRKTIENFSNQYNFEINGNFFAKSYGQQLAMYCFLTFFIGFSPNDFWKQGWSFLNQE